MRPRGYWGLPAFASLSMAGSDRGHAVISDDQTDIVTKQMYVLQRTSWVRE